MKKSVLVSILSLVLASTTFAKGGSDVGSGNTGSTKNLECSMISGYADQSAEQWLRVNGTTQKIQMLDHEGETQFKDSKTNVDTALVATENEAVNNLVGLNLFYYKGENTSNISVGQILLIPNKTKIASLGANQTLLTLHSSASLTPQARVIFIEKNVYKTIVNLGYKGRSMIESNTLTELKTLNDFVQKAITNGSIQNSDLVFFGLDSSCAITK